MDCRNVGTFSTMHCYNRCTLGIYLSPVQQKSLRSEAKKLKQYHYKNRFSMTSEKSQTKITKNKIYPERPYRHFYVIILYSLDWFWIFPLKLRKKQNIENKNKNVTCFSFLENMTKDRWISTIWKDILHLCSDRNIVVHFYRLPSRFHISKSS